MLVTISLVSTMSDDCALKCTQLLSSDNSPDHLISKPALSSQTLASYTKNLLQDSLITGVPQIVQTKNLPRKIIKVLVLVGCIVGFSYQATEFLKIFYSYPTVLDIDVEYPEIIDSPALSFCNLNGVKRIPFCEKYPDRCREPKDHEAFCKSFPDFCDFDSLRNDSLLIPVGDALNFEDSVDFSELQNLGHSMSETLRYCTQLNLDGFTYDQCETSEVIHMAMADGNTGYRNCYTIYSNVNSSLLGKYKLPVPKRKEPLFHMAFELEPEQYFRPDRQVGAIVGIHSPNVLVNPFFNGFVVRPGRLYTVHLKAVEEKLLPSPYDTQCKDYRAAWISRGGKGPLSQEMCVAECIFNASMVECSCAVPDILYPHNERVCTDDELDCFTTNISDCYSSCPQPCDFTDFEYEVRERKLEVGAPESVEDYYQMQLEKQNRAAVLIFLKRPEVIVYSHRPQYEEIEVFSFMGGYIGIWLGVSLVAVFDFVESIGLILNYWIKSRLLQR